jgi:threonine/homoserine/homoserine lactone efflux protein
LIYLGAEAIRAEQGSLKEKNNNKSKNKEKKKKI